MIDNSYIESLNSTDGEIDMILAEALGLFSGYGFDGYWYDSRPTYYRNRLRKLLCPSGPGSTVLCVRYSQNLTDARTAATSLGYTYESGDNALVVCQKALKFKLADFI